MLAWLWDFPGGTSGEELAYQYRRQDMGLIPG